MGEKRKRLSGVHARASTAKRQSTTPAPQPTPPTTAAEPETPTSFTRDGALPVLPACQPDNLSLKEYKSVAERYEKNYRQKDRAHSRKLTNGFLFSLVRCSRNRSIARGGSGSMGRYSRSSGSSR